MPQTCANVLFAPCSATTQTRCTCSCMREEAENCVLLETKALVCARAHESLFGLDSLIGGADRRLSREALRSEQEHDTTRTQTQHVPVRPDDGEATCTRPPESQSTSVLGFCLLVIYGLVKISALLCQRWGGHLKKKSLWPTFTDLPQSQCVSKVTEFWVISAPLLHSHWPLTFFFLP